MKEYKLGYFLSSFLVGIEMTYSIIFTMIPLFIAYVIFEGIFSLLYFLCFLGIVIAMSLIFSIFSFIFSLIKKDKVILYNDKIIHKKQEINIKAIKYIDFHLPVIRGKGQKEIPYGVNICFKKDELFNEKDDYIYIEMFPIKLLKYILHSNKLIKFEIVNLKSKLKNDCIMGLLCGIIILIVLFISEKI